VKQGAKPEKMAHRSKEGINEAYHRLSSMEGDGQKELCSGLRKKKGENRGKASVIKTNCTKKKRTS